MVNLTFWGSANKVDHVQLVDHHFGYYLMATLLTYPIFRPRKTIYGCLWVMGCTLCFAIHQAPEIKCVKIVLVRGLMHPNIQ